MATTKKSAVSPKLRAKARDVLAFAEERAQRASDWVELHNALYGIGGKATELFPTEEERTAFCRTAEYKRINALFSRLPHPPVRDMDEPPEPTNGTISLRLPRSVHVALLKEAQAEGVSLNQLCLSKLVAQLREVV
jgi:hypothetical protein